MELYYKILCHKKNMKRTILSIIRSSIFVFLLIENFMIPKITLQNNYYRLFLLFFFLSDYFTTTAIYNIFKIKNYENGMTQKKKKKSRCSFIWFGYMVLDCLNIKLLVYLYINRDFVLYDRVC